jgi:putative ABC transport system substrate-binding protein
MPTIGFMTPASQATTLGVRFAIHAMKEHGWDENQNYCAVYHWAEGHVDLIPALIDQLVAKRISVMVVFGEAGIQAAQHATKTIPIIGIAADMVRSGLVASMSRPGSNLTGVNVLAGELDVKRLEILHQSVPVAKRIGALALPDRGFDTRPELDTAARQLNLELLVVTVPRIEELAAGLDAVQSAHVDAMDVSASPFIGPARASILDRLNGAHLYAEVVDAFEAGSLWLITDDDVECDPRACGGTRNCLGEGLQ